MKRNLLKLFLVVLAMQEISSVSASFTGDGVDVEGVISAYRAGALDEATARSLLGNSFEEFLAMHTDYTSMMAESQAAHAALRRQLDADDAELQVALALSQREASMPTATARVEEELTAAPSVSAREAYEELQRRREEETLAEALRLSMTLGTDDRTTATGAGESAAARSERLRREEIERDRALREEQDRAYEAARREDARRLAETTDAAATTTASAEAPRGPSRPLTAEEMREARLRAFAAAAKK